MKKLLATLLGILLTAAPLLSATQLVKSAGTATVSIIVQTSAGKKIEGIEVSLEGPNDFSETKNTNSSGEASFTGLEEGDYTSTISLLSGGNYELVTGETATKTRSVAADETETIYYGVQEKEDTPTEEEEETTNDPTITIPVAFYQAGATTTQVDGYTTAQLKSLNNFTLHMPNLSKIVFTQTIDLSSSDAQSRASNLTQYVFMDAVGEVTIASDLMPELNKSATVTLYGLNFVSLGSNYEPMIVKDDMEEPNEVSDVVLIGNDSISFNVTGFSTYAVRPTLEFEETEVTATEATYTLKGRVDDLDSEITIFLNDEAIEEPIEVDEDGNFSVELALAEGENNAQVTARGISEQAAAEVVKITYGEVVTVEESSGIDITMILGVVLLGGGVLGGGYYYYKTKYLPKKKGLLGNNPRNTVVKTGRAAFDSRLLTPEERAVFNNENGDKE